MTLDLRLGRWQEVLADVESVDAIITDPPYSERTHRGHDHGVRESRNLDGRTGAGRRELSYEFWTPADVDAFVAAWGPRCRGWFVALCDHTLWRAWDRALRDAGLTTFQPVLIVVPGMTVRLAGDGPSSWAIHACVARPKALSRWGTLPGAYIGSPTNRSGHDGPVIGGKPLWAMRALVRDYSRPGDLICDPCAGAATTLLAAAIEGRRAIGAECDEATYARAQARLEAGYTPALNFDPRPESESTQAEMFPLGNRAR